MKRDSLCPVAGQLEPHATRPSPAQTALPRCFSPADSNRIQARTSARGSAARLRRDRGKSRTLVADERPSSPRVEAFLAPWSKIRATSAVALSAGKGYPAAKRSYEGFAALMRQRRHLAVSQGVEHAPNISGRTCQPHYGVRWYTSID